MVKRLYFGNIFKYPARSDYVKLNLERASQVSLVFIAICFVVFILYTFSSFLMSFVFAIIITILAVPCTLKEEDKKSHWSVSVFKWAFMFLFLIFIFSIFNIFLQDNVDELEGKNVDASFSDKILGYELDFFGRSIKISGFVDKDMLDGFFAKSFDALFGIVKGFFSQVLTIFIFLIFTIPSYKKFVWDTKKRLNGESRKKFLNSVNIIERNLRSYLLIKTQISILTGVVTALVLYLFGVEYAFLFGFLTFILNYIPSIGSFFAVAIVALFEVFFGGAGLLGWVFLVIILSLIQFLIGGIIEPKIAGDTLSISPIVILLSLFFWGYIWGIWGMFFSVPLTIFTIVIFKGFGIDKLIGLD